MKDTYRYSHSDLQWDYIIKDFMGILGLTLVIRPHEKCYPLKAKIAQGL